MIVPMKAGTIGLFCAVAAASVAMSLAANASDSGPEGGVSAAEIAEIIATAPREQMVAVSDALVTDGERASAYDRYVQCMSDLGVVTIKFQLRPRGGDSIEYRPSAGGDDAGRIELDCRSTFYSAVGAVYDYGHGRSNSEVQALLDRTVQCMRDGGADIPDEAFTIDELVHLNGALAISCYDPLRSGG